jgi:hypothetical protein
MNARAMLRLTAMLGAIHLVICVGSLLLGYSSSRAQSDSPEPRTPGYLKTASSRLVDVLIQPGHSIYRAVYRSSDAPTGVQLLVIVLNSALWGLVIGVGIARLRALFGAK